MRPSEETVLNPEGRAAASSTPSSPASSSPRKSTEIHNLLFPDLSQISTGELPPSPNGIKLSHFEIVDRIGTGGMGSVFLALDLHLQRYVALKILSPSQARDPSAIQRFINEARAAARLDYDGIARVHFYGEDQGYQFIAFEYVTGTNIRELIQHHGPLNPSDAINYTLQIAHALKHTSAAGVVHRDIKPSNIIVNPAGRAKLVDLGLARKESSESMDDLTVAGTTLGTFDYISPEQAQDPRNVDVRSDIYSLGCTLFHMLTGEPPYPEGTLAQKLLEHQQAFVPSPSDLNRQVPAQLAAVCQKMMASDPKRRYQSPESLIRDLLSIATEQGLKAVTPEGLVWSEGSQSQEEPFLTKHAGWLAAIAVLCLIVIGIERLDQEPNPIPSAGLGRQITESGEQTPKVSAENSGKPAGSETDSTNDEIASPTAEASERIGGSLAEESPTEGLSTNSSSNLLELIHPDGIFNSRSPESNDFDLKPLVASNDD
ncbi:MAG: serine/threonine protein kinase, partial [Planctomycetaceae bacterium]|nr:serine/threonine protein kinase [Planctomycetaceae bacterium]